MAEADRSDSPYQHMRRARRFEDESELRRSETEWVKAVRAADTLPLREYHDSMQAELAHYASDWNYESQPGVTRQQLQHAYCEVMALPFITRLELASFYARNGAFPEAKDACDRAFAIVPKAPVIEDPRVFELYRRGSLMRQALEQAIGPEEMLKLFEENFSKLDVDGDGFVHHEELERAQFDLNLSKECQKLIRHLLYRYFEVEAEANDEIGIDIKGISLRDMKAYVADRDSKWKRLSQTHEQHPNTKHRW